MQNFELISRTILAVIVILILALASGCTVVKVVDTAASATVGIAVGAVKTTGAVVGAAIPDGDDDEED